MDTNQLIISYEGTVVGTRNGWGALWRAVRSSRGLPRWMRSECSMVPEAKFYSLDDWPFEPPQPTDLHVSRWLMRLESPIWIACCEECSLLLQARPRGAPETYS